MDTNYYCHKSFGYIFEDKGWLLLRCDPGIINFYSWLTTRHGIEVLKGSRHGPHVSIVRGEKPKDFKNWQKLIGKKCIYYYSINVRDNGYHAWVDVQSDDLEKVREELGLSKKYYHSFHLTIGRLKYACDD
jgi:hypothetical protein